MATLDITCFTAHQPQKITALMKMLYPALTTREAQCLFWTCLNLTKKEIGSRLGISENTVKCHIKSVITKQEVDSIREIKTAFMVHLLLFSALDRCPEGMEGDTH